MNESVTNENALPPSPSLVGPRGNSSSLLETVPPDLIPLLLKHGDFVPRAQLAMSGDIFVVATSRVGPPSSNG